MEMALKEAVRAAERGEVPVGVVIVDSLSGDVLARAGTPGSNWWYGRKPSIGFAEIFFSGFALATCCNC